MFENRRKVVDAAIVEGVHAFLTLPWSVAARHRIRNYTYGKLPTALPQHLDRTFMRVNSVELFAQNPAHFVIFDDYSMIVVFLTILW